MIRIAFLCHKLSLRGTAVAIYDYADCNEKILGNESIIFTRSYEDTKTEPDACIQAHTHFQQRFPVVYYRTNEDVDALIAKHDIDILYCIKSGRIEHDTFITSACWCVIHAVFQSDQPHGDVFAVVGNTVNKLYNTSFPVVPHMIRLHPTTEDMRDILRIPKDALVFGRYGGAVTFDIYDIKKYIHFNFNPNIYFLFMGTRPFSDNPRAIFLAGSADMASKRRFINTCDAMIHARTQGETFGLACGEFALAGKPVITYGLSTERNHLDILGKHALIYNNEMELDFLIRNFRTIVKHINMKGTNPYMAYTPDKVMQQFDQTFIQPYLRTCTHTTSSENDNST